MISGLLDNVSVFEGGTTFAKSVVSPLLLPGGHASSGDLRWLSVLLVLQVDLNGSHVTCHIYRKIHREDGLRVGRLPHVSPGRDVLDILTREVITVK